MTAFFRATLVALFACLSSPSQAQVLSCETAPEAWVVVEAAKDPIAMSDFVLAYSDCSAFRDLGLASLQNQTTALLQTLKSNHNGRLILEHDLRLLRTENGMLKMERDRAVTEARELRGQNNARLHAITATQSDMDALSATIDELVAANTTFNSDLTASSELETLLRAEIAQYQGRIESLVALEAQTRADLMATRDALQAAQAVIDQLRENLAIKEADLEDKANQITDLEGQIEGQETTIDGLERELAEAYRREALSKRLADDRGEQIIELEADLAKAIADFNASQDELETANGRIEELTTQKANLAAQVAQQAMDIEALEEEKEKLTTDNAILRAQVAQQAAYIETLEDDKEEQGELNRTLTQANTNLTDELEGLRICVTRVASLGLDPMVGNLVGDDKAGTDGACDQLLEWVKVNRDANAEKLNGMQEQLVSLNTTNASLVSEIQGLSSSVESMERQLDRLSQYRSRFIALISRIALNTPGIEIEGERARFTTQILFQPGSARLSREGQARLLEVAQAMKMISQVIPRDVGWVFAVEGHTDSDPIIRHRRFQDNWDLAHGRAKAVVDYLVDTAGIDPRWLASSAFAEFQPVAENTTEQGKRLNRRIEFGLVTYQPRRP